MRARTLVIMFVLLFMSGCIQTKRQKMYAARTTFNTTVNVLAAAIEGGTFTDEEAKTILVYAEAAQRLLDEYDAAVELNQPTSVYILSFNAVLLDVVAYRMQLERSKK